MTRTDNPEAPVPEDHGVDRALRIITAATLVLAILALFPWTNDPATTIKFFILHWGAAIMAALWLYGVWTGRKPLGRPGLMGGFLLAFLVINLAAALTSDHVANSLNAWSDLAVVGLLFLFAASAYHTPKQVWRLLAAIAVATALSSVYGFCQRAGLDPFPWATTDVEEYRGLPATFGNPNMASHTLNLAVIMAIALTFRKGTRWCIVPAGLIGAHIVFTEVRAAKVALIAAGVLVAIVFYLRRRRPAPARGALATIVILILLAGIAVGGAMGLTYWRTGSPFPLDRSILLRYNGYLGASQMIADRPALGFGPGNYPLDNPPYWTNYERERFATKPLINAHVHNDYLQAGVEGGAAAAACYIGLLTAALVSALAMAFTTGGPSRRALGLALSACLAAFAVDGLFGFTVHVPASAALFFVLAGAVQGVMGHQAAVHAGDRPKRWARLCGASVCVLALALLCMGTRVFMAQYYFQAARAARYYERFDAAYANLAKGERLAPWDFEFPRQMALLDLNNARTPAAIERMQRSLALRPHDVPGSVILGKAYLNTAIAAIQAQGGQAAIDEALDKAVDAANAALEICPALPNAHALLGRVALVRAQLLPPSDPPSAESLAAYATAKEHLQTALVSAPSDPAQVNTMLATAYASLGETSQALAALKRAARLDPRSDEMWRLYVQMTKTSGKWKPLVNSLETAIEDLYNA
ncbi:MAG: tetratricopeptide repeat protein, partial [Nitrospiraceae bacterium]|nr:tetratricopeptide repeat protein [Nitrospiraceae bacterium]